MNGMEVSRIAALEAELAKELAGLPEALQSSTPNLLVDYLANIFKEEDSHQVPSTTNAAQEPPPSAQWNLLAKMSEEADSPESLEQIAAMEAAAARVAAEICEIERTCLPVNDDLGPPPKAGAVGGKGDLLLVSCKSCGQTVLMHRFMQHLTHCRAAVQQRGPSPAPSHGSLPGSSGRASSEQGRGGRMGHGKGRRGRGMLGKSNLSNGSGLLSQDPSQQRHEPPWSGAAWQGQCAHDDSEHTYACGAEVVTNSAWPPAFIPRRCRSQHSRKSRRVTPHPAFALTPRSLYTFGSPSVPQQPASRPATTPAHGLPAQQQHPPKQLVANSSPQFPPLPKHALHVLKPLTSLTHGRQQAAPQSPSPRSRGRLIGRGPSAPPAPGALYSQQNVYQHQRFEQAAQRRQPHSTAQGMMLPTTSGQLAAPLGQGGPRQQECKRQQNASPPSQPSWPAVASGEQGHLSAGYGCRTHTDTAASQDGILDYGQAAQDDILMYAPVQGDGPMDWSIGLLVEDGLLTTPEKPQVRSLPETGPYGPPAKKMGKLNSITQRLPTLPA